jgi:phosphoribosylformylglycinamidine cyclo-ligase
VGYFANVIDIGGIGLAITIDGVGSKVIVAQMMNRYDTVGIDCVAMNVNDLLCVGARPISLVDYIAVQRAAPDMLDDLARGLCEGARQAGVSIPGGEIAQLRDVISGVGRDNGFDLAAAAIGLVPLDRILIGQAIEEGDVVVGIESSGIHSNGLTLARYVLFEQDGCDVETQLPGLNESLGAELLRPTSIYVREIMQILDEGLNVKALIHITGDGFLNLARVAAEVGLDIDWLPPPPAIFQIIQDRGGLADDEMYRVFNMGIGFCIVAHPADVGRAIAIVQRHGKRAHRIGHAVQDNQRRVSLNPAGLISEEGRFVKK